MGFAEWPRAVVAEIVRRCEARPERESCGFVVLRGVGPEVVELSNVAGAVEGERAAPDAARHAYVMDPAEVLRVHRELARCGGRIAAVWHSHLDGTAALSSRDRAEALADGVEQLPGAEYLVVGLRGARAVAVRAHRIVDGRFVERDVET